MIRWSLACHVDMIHQAVRCTWIVLICLHFSSVLTCSDCNVPRCPKVCLPFSEPGAERGRISDGWCQLSHLFVEVSRISRDPRSPCGSHPQAFEASWHYWPFARGALLGRGWVAYSTMFIDPIMIMWKADWNLTQSQFTQAQGIEWLLSIQK